MYTLAERYLKVLKYASRYTLPQRFGKTIRVDRVKRLALPTAPLTEGVPPSTVALTVENVDVTLDQWGIVASLTDLGLITTKHPMLAKAIDRTALAIAETIEREACKMLLGGTQVQYAGHTSRATLVATDVINTGVILTATTQLRALGAPAFDGDLYAGILPPQVEADILKSDATFQTAHNFVNVRAQEFGEVGVWSGIRWTRGNFLPVFAGVGAPVTTAATATVTGSLTGISGGGYTANVTLANIIVVARDANSDYERKVSQSNTSFALGAGNTGLTLNTPTSTAYVYDIYLPSVAAGTGSAVLAASRQAANTVVTFTTLPTSTVAAPAAPASTVETFVTFIVGRDAFGRVELDGMSLQSYLTPPGASFSNPLAQGRKVGSKIAWKSFILDNNFFVRIESGSFFSAQLPA